MNSVVLLSGGLDSATCLAIAIADKTEPYALTISYGQRHRVELEAAERIARTQGAIEHRVISVDLGQIGGSALTDSIDVPKDRTESEMLDIPVTYVPARNTVMLALALGYAEVVGAERIYVGVNAVDYSGYPDCRPEFIEAFQSLAKLATKAGVEGRPIEISAPLIDLTKPEIIRQGLTLGVDYGMTHSCYDPIDGKPCRRCDSCQIREKAFQSLGMMDPALAL
jgi:7-cyano-7-deazaguanine synthase